MLLCGFRRKMLYLCSRISEERRVKSEEFKSRFPIKGHERKISEERRVKNAIRRTAIAKGTNSNFSLFTLNSSLSKQLRCKSLPNPLQIPFRNGRLKGDKGRRRRFVVEEKMKRLFGGKRKYLYLCRQNTIECL